ncbi:MAG: cupredoxin domain-containing protein [Chloroflexi bacterium]|nr:cupredoxin domain-containing protein [Chloroflexota bacterium]
MFPRVRALALLAALAVTACGGGSTGSSAATQREPDRSAPASASELPPATPAGNPAGAAAVAIVDYGFNPADLTVTVGTTVTWTNTGGRPHTVTSIDGGFTSSGTLSSGNTYAQTFATAGTFAYICGIHNSMKGTITVTP